MLVKQIAIVIESARRGQSWLYEQTKAGSLRLGDVRGGVIR